MHLNIEYKDLIPVLNESTSLLKTKVRFNFLTFTNKDNSEFIYIIVNPNQVNKIVARIESIYKLDMKLKDNISITGLGEYNKYVDIVNSKKNKLYTGKKLLDYLHYGYISLSKDKGRLRILLLQNNSVSKHGSSNTIGAYIYDEKDLYRIYQCILDLKKELEHIDKDNKFKGYTYYTLGHLNYTNTDSILLEIRYSTYLDDTDTINDYIDTIKDYVKDLLSIVKNLKHKQ